MANTSLNLTSLDYETLKEEFRTFMKSQSKFKDFDFDGSNINELFRVMAVNTHKNAFYLNMVASESFLDTSQMISSIRSHAKELNYCPRSARSSKAIINMTFRTNPNIAGSSTVVIPKGTGFATVSNFKTYVFTLPDTMTVSSSNNYFNIKNIELFEGNYVSDSYVMDYSTEGQRFIITNEMVDTSSLSVTVIEDDGQNIFSYLPRSTLLDLSSTSKVFFLQPGPKETYEIIFGDNILGRRPKDGAVIILEYRVSAGVDPNGANRFSVSDDFAGGAITGNITIETVEKAKDGDFPEDIESIRYYAPRHYQIQERAVTVDDYEILMKMQFPEINAISVYGGEDAEPPQYGKVFVAVDISNVDGLPDSKKLEYYQFLKKRSPLSIDPVFIEPEILYFNVSTLVKYNINLTKITPNDIITLVKAAIIEHNETYLDDFKSKLRYSKFIKDIDNSHESIVSNETSIKVYKKINPILETTENFYLRFGLPIKDVKSTKFVIDGEIMYIDDSAGVLYLVSSPRPGVTRRTKKIGSVNYKSGSINIINFRVSSYVDSEIKIICTPEELDIDSKRNQILTVENDSIHVEVEKVRE